MKIQVGGYRQKTTAVYADIDEDDYEKVSKYKWSKKPSSSSYTTYAKTNTGGKKIHLHRFIMGLGDYKDDKRIINHIDGNGLNNCKKNLEICDTLYNCQSFRKHHGNNNIGYVYYDTSMKRLKRWRATIVINKIKHRKRFLTKEEAEYELMQILKTNIFNF